MNNRISIQMVTLEGDWPAPYITAKVVNGKYASSEFHMRIDSGADITTVPKKIAEEAKLSSHQKTIFTLDFAGRIERHIKTLECSLMLGMLSEVISAPCGVVIGDRSCGLLGMDILRRFFIFLGIEKGFLLYHGKK